MLKDLHLSNRLEEKKKSLIKGFMLAVRSFNEKHRGTAKAITVLALVLIALLSALFTCAIFVCSLFDRTTSTGKRIAGIAMAVVLLCVAFFASQKFTGVEKHVATESGKKALQTTIASEEKEPSRTQSRKPVQKERREKERAEGLYPAEAVFFL